MIDNILVSDEVLEAKFICALDKCKGACCYEGDFGAPLSKEEKQILDEIYPKVKSFLDPKSIAHIEKNGLYQYYREMKSWGTSLMPDGACVGKFLTKAIHSLLGIKVSNDVAPVPKMILEPAKSSISRSSWQNLWYCFIARNCHLARSPYRLDLV